jgi:hypothetical protein
MKFSRLIWVVIANVLALAINAMFLSIVVEDTKLKVNTYHWFYICYLAMRAVVPILGIYLEVVDSRFAKWVNVGYFTSTVVVSYGLSLLPSYDLYGYSGQLLLVPITAAGVTYFLYSKWSISSPRPLSELSLR